MATFHFDLVAPEKLLFSSEVGKSICPAQRATSVYLRGTPQS